MHDPTIDVVHARNDLARLSSHGRTPDPDVKAAAQQQLATAKIDRAIRDALAKSPALHPAQVEYLSALLHTPGGTE